MRSRYGVIATEWNCFWLCYWWVLMLLRISSTLRLLVRHFHALLRRSTMETAIKCNRWQFHIIKLRAKLRTASNMVTQCQKARSCELFFCSRFWIWIRNERDFVNIDVLWLQRPRIFFFEFLQPPMTSNVNRSDFFYAELCWICRDAVGLIRQLGSIETLLRICKNVDNFRYRFRLNFDIRAGYFRVFSERHAPEGIFTPKNAKNY